MTLQSQLDNVDGPTSKWWNDDLRKASAFFLGATLIHGSTSRGIIKATMRGLRILACAVAVLLPQAAEAWTVWAGTSPPDLFNVSTAMASAYRFSHRRPFLRWALAPDFCSALHPLLIEEKSSTFFLSPRWLNFTKCERIHQIVREGFDTWSAANPNLHFVDVTNRCEAERMWVPMPVDRCAESDYCVSLENATVVDWQEEKTPLENLPNPQTWLCSHRTCFECARADVVIGGFTQKNRRLGDQHAAARVQRTSLSDARPLSPSGRPADGKTISRAFLEFNVDDVYKNTDNDPNGQGNVTLENCWRLDNDVCDYVIGLELADTAVLYQQSIQTTFWGVFSLLICACVCIFVNLLQRLAANLLTGWDVDRDGKLELQEIVYVLDEFCGEVCFECRCPSVHQKKMSSLSGVLSVLETIAGTAVIVPLAVIACIAGCGVLYVDAVMPCFACRDFRASVVHEIGHLLSLDHSTGEEGVIPLIINPVMQPPAPPPPPPSNPVTDDLAQYNPVSDTGNWTHFKFSCDLPETGVMIDPAATAMLSPPPPPTPPPVSPPPPLTPNATYPPPPATPPKLPGNWFPTAAGGKIFVPNASAEAIANWTLGANGPPVPGPQYNVSYFAGRMGKYLDMNGSIMLAFGSTGFERPIAGLPRRCLDQDDLNGINFLYPSCATQLTDPPCDPILEWENVGARVTESFIKLMALPILIIAGCKILAFLLLYLEDAYATWQVRREAQRLLNEAEAVERSRLAAENGEPPPSPSKLSQMSPMRLFKRKRKVDPTGAAAPPSEGSERSTRRLFQRKPKQVTVTSSTELTATATVGAPASDGA